MISSEDIPRQMLRNWMNGRSPVRVHADSAVFTFDGPGYLTSFDATSVIFDGGPLEWGFIVKFKEAPVLSSITSEEDLLGSVIVDMKSEAVHCTVTGRRESTGLTPLGRG